MTKSGLPNLPQISAGKGGVPCLTQSCSACCHDVEMLLTDADVQRIGAARPGLDFHFQADDGYLQLRTQDGPPALGSRSHAGSSPRPCIFLDASGQCSIHDARPEGCRLYPAVWDDALRGAELDADYCPYTDGFLLAPATVDAVRRLASRLEAERTRRLRPGGALPSNPL